MRRAVIDGRPIARQDKTRLRNMPCHAQGEICLWQVTSDVSSCILLFSTDMQ